MFMLNKISESESESESESIGILLCIIAFPRHYIVSSDICVICLNRHAYRI